MSMSTAETEQTTVEARPLRVSEFAIESTMSQPTVRNWLAQGRIAYIKLGRSIRIPRAELNRLLQQGTVRAREVK
jgi:excisionase family DNA binding protein